MKDGKAHMKQRDSLPEIDKKDQDIIVSLLRATSPVSIDTLCALSAASPLRVLNVIDSLKRRTLVHEKKGYPKGTYFVNGMGFAEYLEKHMSAETLKTIFKRIVQDCGNVFSDEKQKTLVLANLYRKIGDTGDGLSYIVRAAEILAKSGNHEGALSHYDYVVAGVREDAALAKADAPYLIDAILGKISLSGPSMPYPEQASLLARAHFVAKHHKLWNHLARTILVMGELHVWAADKTLDYASVTNQCIREFDKISNRVNDPDVHRICAYLKCEALMFYGRISEVVHRYEDIVGHIEKFGDHILTLRAAANVGTCYVLSGRLARGMGLIEAVRARAKLLNYATMVNFADTLAVLCLLTVGKYAEAESRLSKILCLENSIIASRAFTRFNAFLRVLREEYVEADEWLKKSIAYSRRVGWAHVITPWILDLLDALEKQGFRHEEMNYDGEVERMLKGRDIHMKGAAYRYRAIRMSERQGSSAEVMHDLKQSEKYLKKAGAQIELAHTWVAFSRIYLQKKNLKRTRSYAQKAWEVLSKVDNNLFPKDLLLVMPSRQRIEFMIDRIIAVNETLGSAKDLSLFLGRMIDVSIDVSMATRGAFYSAEEGNEPTLITSRNLELLSCEGGQVELIKETIARVASEGSDLVVPERSGRISTREEALIKAGITSQACVQVKLNQRVYGYLYLDNSLDREPFSAELVACLKLLCSQMAIGISNIKNRDDAEDVRHRSQESVLYDKESKIVTPIRTIIGSSEGIKRVLDQVRQVAPTDSIALIVGQTGTGKELVAKAIHDLSKRKGGPFIPVNISTFPASLVASELFGHERGAFTGASERYRGRFELADGGTLFLDEVGDLPLDVQVKLLRVVDEGNFERLGGSKSIRSNFRIVAATNKDLLREVEKGNFREDLYYRLNVFPIYIPPLMDRKEDILPIAYHFIDKFSTKMRKKIGRVPNEELSKLLSYHWPGNVRELEHFIERAIIQSDGPRISFPGLEHTSSETQLVTGPQSVSLADMERAHIEKVLATTRWRVNGTRGAASLLGLKPSTLFFRMKKLGIKRAPARPL
jgi:transcriptional regulator with GAF, ATPase, and Fis domain